MKALKDLKPYLKAYRRPYLLGAASVAVSSAFLVLKPRFVQVGIDSLGAGLKGEGGPDLGLLSLCAAGIVAVTIVRGFFLFLSRRLMIVASRRIENDLRNDYFKHLEKLTSGFFQANPTGDLMARATNDIAAVRQMLGPGIMYTVNTVVSGALVLANLFLISPYLTLACLITLPLMAYAVHRFGRAIHKRFTTIQDQFGSLTARSQENLAGVRVIRSFAREEHEKKLFEETNRDYFRLNKSYILVESAFRPTIMFIAGLGILIMLFLGGRLIIEKRLTIGAFTAFAIYLGLLVWPAIAVGWVTGLFQRGAASMARIQKILDTKPIVADAPGAHPLEGDRHRIEIRNLSFRYGPEGPWVLKGVSAKIDPGTTTAIVGPTGSGKTTLLNLLARLYPVERGKILVDGADVNDITMESLRKIFGFVSQEAFLFSDTIAKNIAFGAKEEKPYGVSTGRGGKETRSGAKDPLPPGAAERAPARLTVEEAARLAAFDEEIAAFPDGYETMLGERGINLSGGQKQRCAIARALYVNPGILVLDDALSAVDTRTEERILENLSGFAAGRTVIIVSHRISAVRGADQILVLRNGVIEERGIHDDLLRAGGLYADMVEQQRLRSELEVI